MAKYLREQIAILEAQPAGRYRDHVLATMRGLLARTEGR